MDRYLKRERITPRLIWEDVHEQMDGDDYGYLLFDDTMLDKQHSFAIDLVRCPVQ